MSVEIQTSEDAKHCGLQLAHLRTAEDVRDLRANHPEFTEGAMAVFTYPTAPPVAYFSHDNPKFFGGTRATVGDVAMKDDAGNFGVLEGAAL